MTICWGVALDEVARAHREPVAVGNEQLPVGLAHALMTEHAAGHGDTALCRIAQLLETAVVGATVTVEKQPDAHTSLDGAWKDPAVARPGLVHSDVEAGRGGLHEAVQQRPRRVGSQGACEASHGVPIERALAGMRGPQ